MLLTGAELIIEVLKEENTEVIFGYPGGTVINVYDALMRTGGGLKHVLTSHEQGAAHAADGYARSTGRTGVCLVTSGPGATNLVTGIANAYMDSVPMVAITINVSNADLGKDSFQEVDIAGITMPVTKHSFIVKDIEKLAEVLHRAFRIASSGRRGPVLVDITRDVTRASVEYVPGAADEVPRIPEVAGDIDRAAKLIARAKKPLILAGGGAAGKEAARNINLLAEGLDIPAVDTLMGKGIFSGTSPLYLGMAGLYGTSAAKSAIAETDLLIAVGTRFSERVTNNDPKFAPEAKIIHIDIDGAEQNKNVMSDVSITGDAGAAAGMLLEKLQGKCAANAAKRKAWAQYLAGIKKEEDERTGRGLAAAADEHRLTGPLVVRTAYEVFGDDAIVSTEVGLNQMWAATHYCFVRPGQLLSSGGLGTMGFGLGAAIGAAIGNPGRKVINFAGDGCFRMNMNELLTAVRNRLPIVEIIFDNRSLGMVHQLQKLRFEGRYSETEFDDNADYAAIAQAMGAASYRATDADSLRTALEASKEACGPAVIVCPVDRDEIFASFET